MTAVRAILLALLTALGLAVSAPAFAAAVHVYDGSTGEASWPARRGVGAALDEGEHAGTPDAAASARLYGTSANLARASARPSGYRLAPNTADDFVNLASPSRTRHILEGEVRPNGSFGGGHRPGTGFPNKSEFPAGWSDARIMHEISDVATDPRIPWRPGDGPTDFWANGTRGGVDIEVLIRNGEIWTGYPTNVLRNPL